MKNPLDQFRSSLFGTRGCDIALALQYVDELGSPVDITTGTLGITFTNIATGAAYTFASGSVTLTKQYSAQGILSILNPAAYGTAANIRVTVSFTVGIDRAKMKLYDLEQKAQDAVMQENESKPVFDRGRSTDKFKNLKV